MIDYLGAPIRRNGLKCIQGGCKFSTISAAMMSGAGKAVHVRPGFRLLLPEDVQFSLSRLSSRRPGTA